MSAVPYVENINAYYENIYTTNITITTDLNYIEYTLACVSTDSSKCRIEDIDAPAYDYGDSYDLASWFETILNILGGISDLVIDALVNLRGSVEEVETYANRYKVKVNFESGTSHEAAEAGAEFPVVFNLSKLDGSGYQGGTQLTASNTIRYQTSIFFNNSDALPWVFFTTTPSTLAEFEVTLT